ncbi:MAG: hypothetical protein Q7K65_02785 [Candidatus Buchananbacteria bacterium]|nr:hypothetical protein [Candidatus Buchananbacteria bacterium]
MSYKKIIIILTLVLFLLFLVINIPTPLKIEGDGVFYYSWLRSAFFDQDFYFYNELEHFSAYDVGSRWLLNSSFRTYIGKIPNPYAYGTGLLWLPSFILAGFLSLIFNLPPDGYSFFYVWLLNFSSWFFGLASFYIVYLNLKKFFSNTISFWSSLGIYLATPWFYYQFFEPSMSHMASLFIVCLFFNFVIKFYKKERVNLWLFALAIFLMLAVRWQNLLFLPVVLPVLLNRRAELKLVAKRLLSIVAPAVIFWLTQFFLWHHLYGYYFVQPQGRGFVRFDWHGFYVLFSSNRGLLLWSPLLVLAFCGFYFLYKKSKFLFFISISAFSLQWLINGSLNDLGGGDAYGARRFIETLPFLSLALAAFWSKMKNKWLIIALITVFIMWNAVLIQNYRLAKIPHHGEFDVLKINYFKDIIPID